jgi:hypothetical protein
MRCSVYALVCFCLARMNVSAELPVAASVETKCGCALCSGAVFGENEIVLEKEFTVLKGLTICAENLAVYADESFVNEATAGAGICLLDFLSAGIAAKIFSGDGVSVGADGIVAAGHEFEAWGLALEDENEFLYNFTDSTFEYVNTLAIEQSLWNSGESGFGIAFENELVHSGGETESGVLIGPFVGHRFFTAFVNYVLGVSSEAPSHGAEIGTVFEF